MIIDQSKSRLHGFEPEEYFVFHVTFEEGLAVFVDSPVSAKFSDNMTFTEKVPGSRPSTFYENSASSSIFIYATH